MNHPSDKARAKARRSKDFKASVFTLITKDAPLYTVIAICLAPVAGPIGAIGIAAAAYLYTKFAK
jgi:hypothetical protein